MPNRTYGTKTAVNPSRAGGMAASDIEAKLRALGIWK